MITDTIKLLTRRHGINALDLPQLEMGNLGLLLFILIR